MDCGAQLRFYEYGPGVPHDTCPDQVVSLTQTPHALIAQACLVSFYRPQRDKMLSEPGSEPLTCQRSALISGLTGRCLSDSLFSSM